ncbi:MAG TPA: hypothetical protein VFW59_08160 [Gallionella sp.]|nr:hypothetical protein [Gallionella sp.]
MQTKYISYSSTSRPGPLRRLAALVVTVALVALALMFSAVLLAVILIVGAIAGVYLWWKTRAIRKQFKQMQAQMQNASSRSADTQAFRAEAFGGEIIEGEAVRVDQPDARIRH